MDNSVIDMTIDQVGKAFVNPELMDAIGEVLNNAKVNVATVHFTLAYMIAEVIGDDAEDPRDVPCTVMSLQQFMMQIATSVYMTKNKKAPN